jgi:hypothetical protein
MGSRLVASNPTVTASAFIITNPTGELIAVASGSSPRSLDAKPLSAKRARYQASCARISYNHNCIAKRGAPRCACSVRIRHFAATWAGPCVRVSGYFDVDESGHFVDGRQTGSNSDRDLRIGNEKSASRQEIKH